MASPSSTTYPSPSTYPSTGFVNPPGFIPELVSRWRFVLYDFAARPLGEIVDAHDRRISFLLNRPGTIELRLDIENELTTDFVNNGSGMILAYKDDILMMVGEITTMSVTGSENDKSLAVVATETMWPRLTKRLLAQSTKGGLAYKSTATDKGKIVFDQLTATNLGSTTTIEPGGRGPISAASLTITPYKPLLELIQDLAFTVSGFDFWQVPFVPTPASFAQTTKTGELWLASLKGGVQDVVFEYGYGTRSNVDNYNWTWSRQNVISHAYVLPQNYPNSEGRVVEAASDLGAALTYLFREEVISTDLTDDTLRGELAADHIRIRKQAQQIFQFQPMIGIAPQFPADFTTGDIVTARVKDYGINLVDGQVRIYGVIVNLDDHGFETQNLELSLNTS